MIEFLVMLVICVLVLFAAYLITVRLYWSGRFAIYRLVDFSRRFKNNK